METFVCKLIVDGVIPEAQINRPSQVIYLSPKTDSMEVLDQVRKCENLLIFFIFSVGRQCSKVDRHNEQGFPPDCQGGDGSRAEHFAKSVIN